MASRRKRTAPKKNRPIRANGIADVFTLNAYLPSCELTLTQAAKVDGEHEELDHVMLISGKVYCFTGLTLTDIASFRDTLYDLRNAHELKEDPEASLSDRRELSWDRLLQSHVDPNPYCDTNFSICSTLSHAGARFIVRFDIGSITDQPYKDAFDLFNDYGHKYGVPKKAWPVWGKRHIPYSEYLQTEHWQTMRKIMLMKAENRCQVCNSTGPLHVHHRTYERLWEERYSDLTVLCAKCHALYHGKEAK